MPRAGEECWFGEDEAAELYMVESVVWGSDFEMGQYAEVWLLEDPDLDGIETVEDLVNGKVN